MPGRGMKQVRDAQPVRRGLLRKVLLGAGLAAFAVFAVREYPALRREVKIWLM